MPHYHFNIAGNSQNSDNDGRILAGIAEAKNEAAKILGAFISDASTSLWQKNELVLKVSDDTGLDLFTLMLIVQDAPAISPQIAVH